MGVGERRYLTAVVVMGKCTQPLSGVYRRPPDSCDRPLGSDHLTLANAWPADGFSGATMKHPFYIKPPTIVVCYLSRGIYSPSSDEPDSKMREHGEYKGRQVRQTRGETKDIP